MVDGCTPPSSPWRQAHTNEHANPHPARDGVRDDRRRPRHRRDDLRLLRDPGREEAEQARRRRRDGQLRDRAGQGHLPRDARRRRPHRSGRVRRLHGDAAGAAGSAESEAASDQPSEDDATRSLRQRLLVSLVLAVPVVALSMVPALQFDNWQWLCLALASPVVVWGAWPFHRAAWLNLRHGAATMDTLISVGTLAAFGWSLYALFLGDAGAADMRMSFSLSLGRVSEHDEIYLEAAAGVPVFLLAGRYFEAKAKRRSGAALRALLSLGAKDVARLRDGREERVPIDALLVGETVRGSAGREDRDGRRGRRRHLRRRHVPADRRAGARRRRSGRAGGGRDHQRQRPDRRPRDPRRRRHPAGADGAAGDRGAERQGGRPAAGGPDFRRVRSGRHRARGRDARLLARRRRADREGVRGRRRGAHHRLPVRPGVGDADGAARRDGTRRAARHRHQGPRGARVDAQGRHDRAGQDRHRDDRRHDARRHARRRRRRARAGAAARRGARGRVRAPDRRGDHAGGGGRGRAAAGGRELHERARAGRAGCRRRRCGRRRPRRAARRLGADAAVRAGRRA